MKLKSLLAVIAALSAGGVFAQSAELFSYAFPGGDSGLRLAWRTDSTDQWKAFGYDFVRSDFGPWGSYKKMFSPKLFVNGSDGRWTAVWSATPDGSVTALTSTADFAKWEPQRYFASRADLPRDMYAAVALRPDSATVEGRRVGGYVQTVDRGLVDRLEAYLDSRRSRELLYGEQAKDDAERFGALGRVNVCVRPRPADAKPISDKLIGIFFEDINYGADGGLYAELVQNRDFEYLPSDRGGDAAWNALTAWSSSGKGSLAIDTVAPLHPNNPHYAAVKSAEGGFYVRNEGFDGIPVAKGKTYRFSVKGRVRVPTSVEVRLVADGGKVLASKRIAMKSGKWASYKADLKPSATEASARLELLFAPGTDADIDMVSLFPAETFKGRENGLRKDLAETLAAIRPRFVRFPGGCVAHGDGIENIYDWKGSVGPLEARKPLRNLWGYHQTRGLGYHEYFLFCEDIGAEPLPVLAAGVPCQNSGSGNHAASCPLELLGQQNGIPMEDMLAYVADVLDLIEYANGDVSTEWGRRRAEAGHPEPFNLKYIGIGNEDMITEVFEPRFKMIFDAVRAAHPEITVIGTVGPFYEGTDYDRGWELARKLEVPMVDEHYYVAPGWLIYNQDYYDSYPRGGTQVYLGEYASHLPGRPNNIETALSDALYLTAVERNADVVAMTSYAPLLAKDGHTQWRPDMIYFDNTTVRPTPEYYVQRLYGTNSGDMYVPSAVEVASDNDKVRARIGVSVVRDTEAGEYVLKLVNLLPAEVALDIDLDALGARGGKVKGRRISGSPADEDAADTEVVVGLPHAVMPPYSFTVLRVKAI